VSERPHARKFERAPLSLEVHYRTRGSFLVSYSLNLSKGGLFLETQDFLPVGTRLRVRFRVPGAEDLIETGATVMWVRREVSEDGLPPGLGIQFDGLEEGLGAVIDRMVEDFAGVRIMAIANDTPTQERLGRQIRSILTAEVTQATAAQIVIEGFTGRADLALIDLDASGGEGVPAIARIREAAGPPLPVVALSRDAGQRTAALAAGAELALESPPPYELLRARVLELVGKPVKS
jgi:uncharacterized protein (TIGR02266 family)